jgi:hypothetical protein
MTKITVMGADPKKKVLKPIHFVKYLNVLRDYDDIYDVKDNPWDMESIDVYLGATTREMDLFVCIRKDEARVIIFGHFNDGVVGEEENPTIIVSPDRYPQKSTSLA